MKDAAKPENANVQPQKPDHSRAYGSDEDEKKHALDQVQRINDALILREQNTLVSNGVKSAQAYLYNQHLPVIRRTAEKCLSQAKPPRERHAPRRLIPAFKDPDS